MDPNTFDALARAITRLPNRRLVLRGLAGAGIGLVTLRSTDLVDAKKKRKRKKQRQVGPQAIPNAFGCLDVNQPCSYANECCSGICQGTCRAHHTSDCEAGIEPEGCGGTEVKCDSGSSYEGLCATTTGNAGYCLIGADCFACNTDVDCQRANGGFFGPSAACIRCSGCAQTNGTACALAEIRPAAKLATTEIKARRRK